VTSANGIIIAAPASGSGKTVLTLGLLRHLSRTGVAVSSAKAGPDYIDPSFHAAATGKSCFNLDPWAMRPSLLAATAAATGAASTVICEGVMGLFDGAVMEQGSTADLAEITGWPVILVIDAGAQGASAAAVLRGFATHRPGLTLAGVIFNRTGGEKHQNILRNAVATALPDIKVLGCLPRQQGLEISGRHLGLIQAAEIRNIDSLLDAAADLVSEHIDVAAIMDLASPLKTDNVPDAAPYPVQPIGQHIAIAADEAFSFCYPLTIDGWRAQGVEISFFSPLDDQSPDESADAVFLPGGYPELYGYRLSSASRFQEGLRAAVGRGALVYGECGGYMALGKGMIDADGARHAMAGLLPLETSFATRQLHLGYRQVELDTGGALGCGGLLGKPGTRYRGHEFHYATVLNESPGAPLFKCLDVSGNDLGLAGLADGRVMGSFIHLIDRVGDENG